MADIFVIQQIVITVKTNMLNRTKDARNVIVRHTLKDLFGMSDADEYTIIYFNQSTTPFI